ncbi:MAG: hypothetical protein Q9217_004113 [Psora testacea]
MATSRGSNDLADAALLEKIDKLFEANIGEYVALPQLLVVGDQSSGKSSILEGLTGLPFPRDKGLCTRFATQITFRRISVRKISVSIVPAADASPDHVQSLRAWKKDDLPQLGREKFAEIMGEVRSVMGLAEPQGEDSEEIKSFSDDVLKIEICGPEEQHLSVVDVPGIFRRKTSGVTTETDKVMVKNMVSSYMQNPRSVILAIIPANVDIATQEILEMAEEHDPDGQRTLGVLTKPDLVDPGAELAVIDILNGKSHQLKLGWCVVLNPGQKALDNPSADRHVEEKHFFKIREPWNYVAKDHAGIEALRGRLVRLLAEMIEREFPKVKAEISQRLKVCKQNLEHLGPSRGTKDQQYTLILDLATRFQRIATLALNAHYGGDDVFESFPNLRLATAIVNRNEKFSEDVWKKGHKMAFRQDAFLEEEASELDTSLSEEDLVFAEGNEKLYPVRHVNSYWELEDILFECEGVLEPKATGIKNWLMGVYKSSRGFELGTFDASLLPIIWKKQSTKWNALALGYISDVVCIVHGFTLGLLPVICKDARIQKGLKSVLLDRMIDKYKRSIEHANFILAVERAGTPLTTNHYFADNLEKCRQERTKASIKDRVIGDCSHGSVIKLEDITTHSKSSNVKQTIDDLHDILRSYYKVARKRFVDVMCMQAADFHLVTGPDTPIKIFSPALVNELTPKELEMIAGEDASTQKKRNDLKHDIKILENGRKILI